MSQTVIHPLPPLIWPDSRILILGTMPSPRSRAEAFYYATRKTASGRFSPPCTANPIPVLPPAARLCWPATAWPCGMFWPPAPSPAPPIPPSATPSPTESATCWPGIPVLCASAPPVPQPAGSTGSLSSRSPAFPPPHCPVPPQPTPAPPLRCWCLPTAPLCCKFYGGREIPSAPYMTPTAAAAAARAYSMLCRPRRAVFFCFSGRFPPCAARFCPSSAGSCKKPGAGRSPADQRSASAASRRRPPCLRRAAGAAPRALSFALTAPFWDSFSRIPGTEYTRSRFSSCANCRSRPPPSGRPVCTCRS